MNIVFIKYLFVGFMVSEIPRVSVFWNYQYSVTFPYLAVISTYLVRRVIQQHILYRMLIL